MKSVFNKKYSTLSIEQLWDKFKEMLDQQPVLDNTGQYQQINVEKINDYHERIIAEH